ncbi:hypothetical protein CB0101_11460 [Synechococcus sp. CB0101]|uniref:hypothetical protein n=1 Tax=Synechococcus sp. CB0101 TaxID=232348 RepID=UPI0002002251|nr:hypothetical protein [Synechococcus sp. CB0101]QCH15458.1 hypothetical protein CB0101_11460 [Synechococcus sp. CB0101]
MSVEDLEFERLIDEILGGEDDEEEELMIRMAEAKRTWGQALNVALTERPHLINRNFIQGDQLLVFDEASGRLEEVALWDLPLRFPIDERWVDSDFGKVLRLKFAGYRQSIVAHALARENDEAMPLCSAVVLVIPADENWAYSYIEVRRRAVATI